MFSFNYNLFKRLWCGLNLACLVVFYLNLLQGQTAKTDTQYYKTTMSICRVLYVKLSWVICTMKHLPFIFLTFDSWEKTCCIQKHMQTLLFIFRTKAPALLCGKSLHGHWHVRRYIPKPPFFSSTPQTQSVEGSRF